MNQPSSTPFRKIEEGLSEAVAVARGEAEPAAIHSRHTTPNPATVFLGEQDTLPAALQLNPPQSLETAIHQRDLLAAAAYNLLVSMNVIRPDAPCSSPALLSALEETSVHLTAPADPSTPSFTAIIEAVSKLSGFVSGDPAILQIHTDLTRLHGTLSSAFCAMAKPIALPDIVARMNDIFEGRGMAERVTWYPGDHANDADVIAWDDAAADMPTVEARFDDSVVSVHCFNDHRKVTGYFLEGATSESLAKLLATAFANHLTA